MAIELAAVLAGLKTAAGVARAAGKIDLYQQLIESQQMILDAQSENLRLTSENSRLSRELEEATRKRSRRDKLRFQNAAYWEVVDGKVTDGPFCPKCLDADDKEIRMTDRRNGFTCCVHCDRCIKTAGYIESAMQSRRVVPEGF